VKALIAIVLIAGFGFIGWKLYEQWVAVQEPEKPVVQVISPSSGAELEGLPPSLESALATAQQQGADGLRNFLKRYGKAIRDPRLAWIELDYAVLVMREDIAEARKVFARVKERTPPSSPVYPRIKQLENTYE